jgi:hypothetical protein
MRPLCARSAHSVHLRLGEATEAVRSSSAINHLRLGRNGWRKPGRQIRTMAIRSFSIGRRVGPS